MTAISDRKKIIDILVSLGEDIKTNIDNQPYISMYKKAEENNPWFLQKNIRYALKQILMWLDREKLTTFADKYKSHSHKKNLAIVCAGNIPAVSFHDIICGLLSGYCIQVKLSSSDKIIIPFLLERMQKIEPLPIEFEDKIKNFNVVIATGSNNTSLYFGSYFSKFPHIIRKSRSSLSVVTEKDDITGIEDDIFMYFGLGCRNVSLLFLPHGYDTNKIKQRLCKYSHLIDFYKYKNNYDYYKALFEMNNADYTDTGFCLLRNEKNLHCPISAINYCFYQDINEIEDFILQHKEEVQCLVAQAYTSLAFTDRVDFGKAQSPKLEEFADSVDTMSFLEQVALK